MLDSEVSATEEAWRAWRSGLAGCLPRALADKCLAERECLAEEDLEGSARLEVLAGSACLEVLAGWACLEVLAVPAESIIMISESGIGAEDNTLRGVFAGEDELEEHELEEDVIEDIFVVDGELIIHIFTGEIFSYLCTFFHSLYTCPFSRRCENYCHRCLSNLRGREVAPASNTSTLAIRHLG